MTTSWRMGNDYCSFENVQYGESNEDMAPGSTKPKAVWGRYVDKAPDHKPKSPETMTNQIYNWADVAELKMVAAAFKTDWKGGGWRWDIQEMYRVIINRAEVPQFNRQDNKAGWIKLKDVPQEMKHEVSGTVTDGNVTTTVSKYEVVPEVNTFIMN